MQYTTRWNGNFKAKIHSGVVYNGEDWVLTRYVQDFALRFAGFGFAHLTFLGAYLPEVNCTLHSTATLQVSKPDCQRSDN